ncbi:MAG TPA: right-handed parallel beta-helix repeat-containing protein [Candidatus Synoicihabitans sp.]|nr:right-handed parallel beta-helix repeat-containing protein [Candidatus Synoicihabitans sp.]
MSSSLPRWIFGAVALLAASASHARVELWVAPGGSDTAAGTSETPFATLAAAQRHARELRRLNDPAAADGITIWLRGGTYPLTAPVRFRPEDSGTAASPTAVRAAPGERPVLSGGVTIRKWRRPTQPLVGLPAHAQEHVWVAEVPLVRGRPLEFRQLWIGARKAVRARHPNGPELARLQSWDVPNETAGIPAALLGAITSPTELELVVQQQWAIGVLRVREIKRDGDRAILAFHQPESRLEFDHPWPQPILPPEGGGACYLVNAIELLDTPGEWFLDRARGQLLYWPLPDEDASRLVAVAPALETLLTIEGSVDRPVQHVSFDGIGFAHTTWLRPSHAGHVPLQAGMYLEEAYKLRPKGTADWRSLDNQAWIGRPPAAVTLSYAQHVNFDHCRFTQLAMNGLDQIAGAHDTLVQGGLFRDIGGNPLLVGSFQTGPIETHLPYDPTDERELCQRTRLLNNRIVDAANEDWGSVGIAIGYARDVTIEHNDISDVSYTAISLGWGWTRTLNAARNHRVRANHLHHYATRLCDTAGVYTLSAQPGTIIERNAVHSVTMSPYVDRPDHWFYLYLDEGSSFIQVRDNWTPEERFFENAIGPGNIWHNNGPGVAAEIRAAAGLQPEFRHLLHE